MMNCKRRYDRNGVIALMAKVLSIQFTMVGSTDTTTDFTLFVLAVFTPCQLGTAELVSKPVVEFTGILGHVFGSLHESLSIFKVQFSVARSRYIPVWISSISGLNTSDLVVFWSVGDFIGCFACIAVFFIYGLLHKLSSLVSIGVFKKTWFCSVC